MVTQVLKEPLGTGPVTQIQEESPASSAFTDSLREDKGNKNVRDGFYRGNLVFLSQFLTSFRSAFLWNDSNDDEDGGERGSCNDELSFIIQPHDIENALIYRYWMRCKDQLLDQQCALQTEDMLMRIENCEGSPMIDTNSDKTKIEQEKLLAKKLLNVEAHLKKASARDQKVHSLLQRFEVWTTKDLAHDMLMAPCSQQIESAVNSCWSKLMHIPGAAYFADRLPLPSDNAQTVSTRSEKQSDICGEATSDPGAKKMENQPEFAHMYHQAHVEKAGHPLCSLILPPNRHTWEEYARISHMISCLPSENDRKAATNSVFIGSKPHTQRKTGSIYSADFSFEPHDLVALWVRAQRNSMSLRHLVQLYECACARPDSSIRLEFKGNHRSAKRRVFDETKLVNTLIEWAVLNQSLLHFHFMQQQLTAQRSQTKRNRLDSSDVGMSKKMKQEASASSVSQIAKSDPETELLRACYGYLLNWFCRRNQHLIGILYCTKQVSFPPLSVGLCFDEDGTFFSFQKECVLAGIPDAIVGKLKANHGKAVSKSLSRIYRKMLKGKFDPSNFDVTKVADDPFFCAVNQLLEAWKYCMEENSSLGIAAVRLDAVLEDFKKIYSLFHGALRDGGILHAASRLIDSDFLGAEDDVASITSLLRGIEVPWKENCAKCNQGRTEHDCNNEGFFVCASCECVFHKQCCDSSTFRSFLIGDLLKHYSESDLFGIEVPHSDAVQIPDYRVSRSFFCETQTLTLARDIDENGKLEPLGATVRQTEDARNAMDFVLGGRLNLGKLFGEDIIEEYPIGVTNGLEGLIVIDVNDNSVGAKAGLRQGDIIVATKYPGEERVHDFSRLAKEERFELLKPSDGRAINLIVKRPNTNIVAESINWIECLREHNKTLKTSYLDRAVNVCDKCCPDTPRDGADLTSASARIKSEAVRCRAVIRTLGRESYSRSFLDEEGRLEPTILEDGHDVHLDFVSLRRLDAQMTYIIYANSDESGEDGYKKRRKMRLLENAFYLPPTKPGERTRLRWAPKELDSHPADLLFDGIGILIKRKRACVLSEGQAQKEHKMSFLRRFLSLFSLWCANEPEPPVKNPPPANLVLRAPWMTKTCLCCCARGRSAGELVCNSPLCTITPELTKKHIPTYEKCAGLIGTSVFVFNGDNRLQRVENGASIKIESFGRAVEFIVSGYFPPVEGCVGEFFLLPVVSKMQLQYLVDRLCLLKDPPSVLSTVSKEEWIEGSVLGLQGVLRVSEQELHCLIEQTTFYFDNVDIHVARCAQRKSPPSRLLDRDAKVDSASEVFSMRQENMLDFSRQTAFSETADLFLFNCVKRITDLLESAVLAPAGATRSLIESRCGPIAEPVQDDLLLESRRGICPWTGENVAEGFIDCQSDKNDLDLNRENFVAPDSSLGNDHEMLYSDLYFTSDKERDHLERALSAQKVCVPTATTKGWYTKTIVLCRGDIDHEESLAPEYSGVGWGFELLLSRHRSRVQVGRVHPNSPAARAGLRTNDVVVAINGRDLKHQTQWSPALMSAVLGSSFCVRSYPDFWRSLASALSKLSQCPVRGPVIFLVKSQLVVDKPEQTQVAVQSQVLAATLNQQQERLFDTGDVDALPCEGKIARECSATVQQPAEDLQRSQRRDSSVVPEQKGLLAQDGASPSSYDRPGSNLPSATAEDVCDQDEVEVVTTVHHQGEKTPAILRKAQTLAQILIEDIRSTLHLRSSVNSTHCYAALGLGTVLTQVEAAALIEAIYMDMPMLGIRLLCPRYTLDVAAYQLSQLYAHRQNLQLIPRLTKNLWQRLMAADYERFKREPQDAPKIFHDSSGSFALSENKLPVDRLVEEELRTQLAEQKATAFDSGTNGSLGPIYNEGQRGLQVGHQMHQQHSLIGFPVGGTSAPPAWNNGYRGSMGAYYGQQNVSNHPQPDELQAPQYQAGVQYQNHHPERIRGGGGDLDDSEDGGEGGIDSEGVPLETLPRDTWDNQLVQVELDATVKGEDRGTQMFFGYVQMVSESFRNEIIADLEREIGDLEVDDEMILVALVFSQNIGAFSRVKLHFLDPWELFLIEDGSHLALLAKRAEESHKTLEKFKKIRSTQEAKIQKKGSDENSISHEHPTSRQVEHLHQSNVTALTNIEDCEGDTGVLGEQMDFQNSRVSQEHRPTIDEKPIHLRNSRHYRRTAQIDEKNASSVTVDENAETTEAPLGSVSQQRPVLAIAERTRTAESVDHESSQDPYDKRSESLLTETCKKLKETASITLGSFPDGRLVMWLGSDPVALYIENSAGTWFPNKQLQKEYRDCVEEENPQRGVSKQLHAIGEGLHCCVWGCTYEQTREERGHRLFECKKESELAKHISHFHNFGTSDAATLCELSESKIFSRVAVRRQLQEVKQNLVAAACARSAELSERAKREPTSAKEDPVGLRVHTWPSRYKLSLRNEDILEFMERHQQQPTQLAQILCLLSNITALFKFEGETVCLSGEAIKVMQNVMMAPRVTRQVYEDARPFIHDDCVNTSNVGLLDFTNCSLCALCTEQVIHRPGRDSTSGDGSPIGCAVPGILLAEQSRLSDPKPRGYLGHAKAILLRLIRVLPLQLRLIDEEDPEKDKIGYLRKRMWKPEGIRNFRRFVLQSTSVEMLAQAFVSLVACVKHEKLPSWWRSEELGYSLMAQRQLMSPSLSSVMSHMLTFDLACNEYMETAAEARPFTTLGFGDDFLPPRLKKLAVADRVALVMKTASKHNVPKVEVEGSHGYHCMVCLEGGDLFCCEFCNGVIHSNCCSEPIDSRYDWVCAACTVDIMELDT